MSRRGYETLCSIAARVGSARGCLHGLAETVTTNQQKRLVEQALKALDVDWTPLEAIEDAPERICGQFKSGEDDERMCGNCGWKQAEHEVSR